MGDSVAFGWTEEMEARRLELMKLGMKLPEQEESRWEWRVKDEVAVFDAIDCQDWEAIEDKDKELLCKFRSRSANMILVIKNAFKDDDKWLERWNDESNFLQAIMELNKNENAQNEKADRFRVALFDEEGKKKKKIVVGEKKNEVAKILQGAWSFLGSDNDAVMPGFIGEYASNFRLDAFLPQRSMDLASGLPDGDKQRYPVEEKYFMDAGLGVEEGHCGLGDSWGCEDTGLSQIAGVSYVLVLRRLSHLLTKQAIKMCGVVYSESLDAAESELSRDTLHQLEEKRFGPVKFTIHPQEHVFVPSGRLRIVRTEKGQPFPDNDVFFEEQKLLHEEEKGYRPPKSGHLSQQRRRLLFNVRVSFHTLFVGVGDARTVTDHVIRSQEWREVWKSEDIGHCTPNYNALACAHNLYSDYKDCPETMPNNCKALAIGLEHPVKAMLLPVTLAAETLSDLLGGENEPKTAYIQAENARHAIAIDKECKVDGEVPENFPAQCGICGTELFNTYFSCLGCQHYKVEKQFVCCAGCLGQPPRTGNACPIDTKSGHVVVSYPQKAPFGHPGSDSAGDKRKRTECKCGADQCQFCFNCPRCACVCHQMLERRCLRWKLQDITDRHRFLVKCKVREYLEMNKNAPPMLTESPLTSPRAMLADKGPNHLCAVLTAFLGMPGIFGWLSHFRDKGLLLPVPALLTPGCNVKVKESSGREALTRLELLQRELHSQHLPNKGKVNPIIMVEWAGTALTQETSPQRPTFCLSQPALLLKQLLLQFSRFRDELSHEAQQPPLCEVLPSHEAQIVVSVVCTECKHEAKLKCSEPVLKQLTEEAVTDSQEGSQSPLWEPFQFCCQRCSAANTHDAIKKYDVEGDPPCLVFDVSHLQSQGMVSRLRAMRIDRNNCSYKLVAAICARVEAGEDDEGQRCGYAVEMVAPASCSEIHEVIFSKGDYIRYDEKGDVTVLKVAAEVAGPEKEGGQEGAAKAAQAEEEDDDCNYASAVLVYSRQ